jgi:hypothetical protein
MRLSVPDITGSLARSVFLPFVTQDIELLALKTDHLSLLKADSIKAQNTQGLKY